MATNNNNNTNESPFPMVIDKKEDEPHEFKPPKIINSIQFEKANKKYQLNQELKLQDNAKCLTFNQLKKLENDDNITNFKIQAYIAAKSSIIYKIPNSAITNSIALQCNLLDNRQEIQQIREKTVKKLGLTKHLFYYTDPKVSQFNSKISHSQIQESMDKLNREINVQIQNKLCANGINVQPYIELYLYDLSNECKTFEKIKISLNDLNAVDTLKEGSYMNIYNVNIFNDQLVPLNFQRTPILQTQQYKIPRNCTRTFYHWGYDFSSDIPCDLIGRFLRSNVNNGNNGNGSHSETITLANLFGNPLAFIQVKVLENTNQRFWKFKPNLKKKEILIIKSVQIDAQKTTRVEKYDSGKIISQTYYCYSDYTTEFCLAKDFLFDIQNKQVQKGYAHVMRNATNL